MCQGGGDFGAFMKQYPLIKMDSRAIAEIGRGLHMPSLTAEAKHNEANPGRGLTKAAIAAASYWLGGEAGSAMGSGGEAAGTAADIGSTGIDATSTVIPYINDAAGIVGTAGGGAPNTTEALAQIANQAAVNSGNIAGAVQTPVQIAQNAQLAEASQASQGGLLNSLSNARNAAGDALAKGAYRTMVPGVGTQQADMLAAQTGDFGSYGLGQTMQAASGAQGLSPLQSALGNYGGKFMDVVGSAHAPNTNRLMLAKTGMDIMTPHRPPPTMAPPPQPGPQGPLANPYQSGNPYQNSLTQGGSMPLTEEQKIRLRAMGYPV